MIMTINGRILLTPLLLALATGCVSLGRDSPPVELYVIGGAASQEVIGPLPGLEGLTIGVRRLHLAPYLATPAIVVRRGSHGILTSDYHRWGEDLAVGINRAVARYLGDGAQFRTVDVAPWPVGSRYDYLVQLRITRFEGVVPAVPPEGSAADAVAGTGAADGTGAVHMVASWEIVRQQDGTVLTRGTTEFREGGWRVGDYAVLVALLDQGLVMVARDVAAALGVVVAAARVRE
jgi:uncharacterized lipoprotein YmbA